MGYPDTPGYARHSDTSKEAAENLTGKDALYSTILNYMRGLGYFGAIVDEALEVCEKCHARSYDRSTIAARFTELEAQGRIMRTNQTRKTARNRNASVYVVKAYFQESMRFEKPKSSAERQIERLKEANSKAESELRMALTINDRAHFEKHIRSALYQLQKGRI